MSVGGCAQINLSPKSPIIGLNSDRAKGYLHLLDQNVEPAIGCHDRDTRPI